jgi:hypothetical protein
LQNLEASPVGSVGVPGAGITLMLASAMPGADARAAAWCILLAFFGFNPNFVRKARAAAFFRWKVLYGVLHLWIVGHRAVGWCRDRGCRQGRERREDELTAGVLILSLVVRSLECRMRSNLLCVLLCVLCVVACLLMCPSAAMGQDVAAKEANGVPTLTQGVDSIATAGIPGPIAVYGERAFCVIAGSQYDGALLPVVAGAEWGRGRVVAFGHGGLIGKDALADAGAACAERGAILGARCRARAGRGTTLWWINSSQRAWRC